MRLLRLYLLSIPLLLFSSKFVTKKKKNNSKTIAKKTMYTIYPCTEPIDLNKNPKNLTIVTS